MKKRNHTMAEYSHHLSAIDQLLSEHRQSLINYFSSARELGIPSNADKIVLWVPCDNSFNIQFNYMDKRACETGPQPESHNSLQQDITPLLEQADESLGHIYPRFRKEVDERVARWFSDALKASGFADKPAHKVMAIDQLCAYMDLDNFEWLTDEAMWS